MQRIDAYLSDYAAYHQTRGNIACHFVGIPLIVYSIIAFFLQLRLNSMITAADILIAVSFLFYATLDLRLAILMLISTALLDLLGRSVGSPLIAVVAFVVGWVFQGIGHAVFEKKSPAFLRNLIHLMVGPIFLLNELFHFRTAAA